MTFGDDVIKAAGKYLGVPYAWGGGDINGPSRGIRDGGTADRYGDYQKIGFDCSGLTLYSVYQASKGSIRLPHRADMQRRMGEKVSGEPAPGDLIAFSSNGGAFYHHIGIYIGNGMLRNAPQSGKTVSDMPLSNWNGEKQEIRRFGTSGVRVSAPDIGNQTGDAPETKGSFMEGEGLIYVAMGAIAIVGLLLIVMGGS